MQHAAATVEEQLLLKSIREECPWESLPKRLQATLTSKEEWHRRVMEHCIKKRIQWNACFARKVCKEGEYYEEMMRYLRKNLALFPYHLAEYVCRVMRVSPFKYYCEMIFEVMRNEQPYDSMPNFSAADALRLTGIGRNEFIDIMNKCRSKKIMWKLNKSIAKELLPTQPVDFPIEPWWGVCLVNFTLEEFKKLSEEEMGTIDKVCKEEANSFVLFDPDIVRGLYRRGLVYFDVPVYPDDRFKVSRLEGFISNREQSYEDPIEELLYAVFVVSSENATVSELAATLLADLSQLQAAASFACRLGWAVKILDPASVLQDLSLPNSPRNILSDEEEASNASIGENIFASTGDLPQADGLGVGDHAPATGSPRVAFLVDANITSYLMMGSVSPGLKSHAVTLYEAGKLGDASIAELCKDLTALEGKRFEGELQEFANHAFSLRSILECLRSGGITTDAVDDGATDRKDMQPPTTDMSNMNIIEKSTGFGTTEESEVLIEDDSLDSTESKFPPVISFPTESALSESSTGLEKNIEQNQLPLNDANLMAGDSLTAGKGILKKHKKYRLDILRSESLASLAPATLDRLFHRDYNIVVSMIPLPSTSVLPRPSGPVHFGPPSYSSMTPWMKLILYLAAFSGPISVVLMKGQCLRLLPVPLAGCEKALIWSWDGHTVGGLGGKFEGNLVNGSILLHCLNSVLKHSAVLVQPLNKHDLDEHGRIITLDIPLPLKSFDGSVAPTKKMGLCAEECAKVDRVLNDLATKMELQTIGYIRLLRLQKETESDQLFSDNMDFEWVPLSLEFGIPLFSPNLCQNICERVVSSHMLQMDSLAEHHDAMQGLRKKLREICAEYQATGPTAKLLYHRDHTKESSRQLMNYASGRWNPLSEPSTPITGSSSEHQRLKLANRARCRSEVLSFDGNILRSYALSPVYEAATRPVEDLPSTSVAKTESDDADSKEVVLPGVNLIFDGSRLHPFDIGACLQARQPVSLIAEASAASAAMLSNRTP